MRTRVMPQVISVTELSNSAANSLVVSETVKKSNESHVQPKNATYICLSIVAAMHLSKFRYLLRRTAIAVY